MSCEPELVTGYVDGALDEAARAAVEAHLVLCPACRDQAESERALRQRLRALAGAEPRPALAASVRRRLKQRPLSVSRIFLATAAGLALLFLWGRGLHRSWKQAPCIVLRETLMLPIAIHALSGRDIKWRDVDVVGAWREQRARAANGGGATV